MRKEIIFLVFCFMTAVSFGFLLHDVKVQDYDFVAMDIIAIFFGILSLVLIWRNIK